MSKITHASIIPLIGGSTIATHNSTGIPPKYIASYKFFANNDKHIISYYNNNIPYYIIDNGDNDKPDYVDIVSTICPCAGLSSLNTSANTSAEINDWLFESATYTLSKIKPKVFFGENAPRLGTNFGKPIANRMAKLAKKYNYVFSIIKTQSKLHGLSQTRNRTFYFFWKDTRVPLIDLHNKEPKLIQDLLSETVRDPLDPMDDVVRKGKPTETPFYKYYLTVLNNNNQTHSEFCNSVKKSNNIQEFIEEHPDFIDYNTVAKWMDEHGYTKEAKKCRYNHDKLAAGKNIMRRNIYIPKNIIGAFVGYYPENMVHPIEDRFLTYRECARIMALPDDFVLQDKERCINHFCQNIPVSTAQDITDFIVKYIDNPDSVEYIDADYVVQSNIKRGDIEIRIID